VARGEAKTAVLEAPRLQAGAVNLSARGQEILIIASGASFLLAVMIGFVPLRTARRAMIALGAPLLSIAVIAVRNPGGSCNYDCPGRIAVILIWMVAVGAWFLGLAAGTWARGSSK
jgi:hypothetical protein